LVRVNYGKPSAHCLRAKFQAQAEEMLRVHGATRIEAGEPAKT
jgi:hypothetical protein